MEEFLSKKKESTNDFYIVIDGEPNPIPRQNVDLVITSKKNTGPNDIYIPYWVMMIQEHKKNIGDLMEPACPNKTSIDKWMQRKLIVFCYSNANTTRYRGSADRAKFFQILSQKLSSRAHNLGKQLANVKDIIHDNPPRPDSRYWLNDNMYKNYKFVVAFENSAIEGYVTEKIVNPFYGGSIPVYLGARDINEHFNPESFINVNNYPTFEACIDDIISLSTDIPRLKKMLEAIPLISHKYLGLLKMKGSDIRKQFSTTALGYTIAPTTLNNYRTHFITFAPSIPKLPLKKLSNMSSTTRIKAQATKSKCFDEIVALTYDSLPYEFLELHQNFTKQHNNENFGLGIWKPWLLKHYLETVLDGDICCFASTDFQLTSPLVKKLPELCDTLLRKSKQEQVVVEMREVTEKQENINQDITSTSISTFTSSKLPSPNTNPCIPFIGAFKSSSGNRLCLHHSTKRDIKFDARRRLKKNHLKLSHCIRQRYHNKLHTIDWLKILISLLILLWL